MSKNDAVSRHFDGHDSLECAVCTETYTNPKLLHCMHTFCEGCIQQMLLRDNTQVVCPLCRYVTQVGKDVTLSLWRSHIIQQKVHWQAINSKRENNSLSCSECETDTATQLCCDCQWKLCEVCASHHKRCARYKDHTLEDIEGVSTEELVEPEKLQCTKHKQDLRYYCTTCNVSVCGDCSHSEVHQGHTFKLTEDIMEEKVKALQKFLQTSHLSFRKYDEHLNKFKGFQKTSLQEMEFSKKVVEETFDELISILQKEKNNVLQWLNGRHESFGRALKAAEEEAKIVETASNYLEAVVKFPKEEIFDIVEGVKQWKETVVNMKNARTDYAFRNKFVVDASSRQVRVSKELCNIKQAFQQMFLLPEKGSLNNRIIELKPVFSFQELLFPSMWKVYCEKCGGREITLSSNNSCKCKENDKMASSSKRLRPSSWDHGYTLNSGTAVKGVSTRKL